MAVGVEFDNRSADRRPPGEAVALDQLKELSYPANNSNRQLADGQGSMRPRRPIGGRGQGGSSSPDVHKPPVPDQVKTVIRSCLTELQNWENQEPQQREAVTRTLKGLFGVPDTTKAEVRVVHSELKPSPVSVIQVYLYGENGERLGRVYYDVELDRVRKPRDAKSFEALNSVEAQVTALTQRYGQQLLNLRTQGNRALGGLRQRLRIHSEIKQALGVPANVPIELSMDRGSNNVWVHERGRPNRPIGYFSVPSPGERARVVLFDGPK